MSWLSISELDSQCSSPGLLHINLKKHVLTSCGAVFRSDLPTTNEHMKESKPKNHRDTFYKCTDTYTCFAEKNTERHFQFLCFLCTVTNLVNLLTKAPCFFFYYYDSAIVDIYMSSQHVDYLLGQNPRLSFIHADKKMTTEQSKRNKKEEQSKHVCELKRNVIDF